jgi:CHRD domain/PEP-CTERM motif
MKLFHRAAMILAGAALALPATALQVTYGASLSGAAESPPNGSAGTGTATVIIDDVANTMEVMVSFSGLSGTTTASHIHCCTAAPGTGTAGVATVVPTFTGFPLGVTSGTYDHTFDMTQLLSYNAPFVAANGGTAAGAFASLVTGINAGKAYLNIHTSAFGGGEIRGFLAPVPEPQTYALMLIGLAAVGAMARRRRAR